MKHHYQGSKLLLIDADLLVYRCGFAADKKKYTATALDTGITFSANNKKDVDVWIANYLETVEGKDSVNVECIVSPDPVEYALQNVSTVVDALAEKFEGSKFEFFLTGKNNFRHDLATLQEYKGNRKDAAKPTHYDAIRDFLVYKYNATVVDGEEADDAIGIRATALGNEACIVSVDKDLSTIPGWHYDWVKKDLYYVDERESYRNFYTQVLMGDRTDNIPGIDGVGPKTAKDILKGYTSPKAMWQACVAEYVKHYPEGFMGKDTKQAVIEIARLLYIRKQEGEMWQQPV